MSDIEERIKRLEKLILLRKRNNPDVQWNMLVTMFASVPHRDGDDITFQESEEVMEEYLNQSKEQYLQALKSRPRFRPR